MDLSTLGVAMGSAWLSGINLYVPVLTLGLLQHFQLAHLPGDLEYLGHTWVLITAGILYSIHLIAAKIPAGDSAWDVPHTFIRIPAGAVLAATAFAYFDPKVRLLALLLGGGIALTSHGAKTATRLAANTSPEPFSNWMLSLFGDAVSFLGTLFMVRHPIVLGAIVAAAPLASFLLFRWVFRSLRKLFQTRLQPSATST